MSNDTPTTEQRIQRLEHQNRLLMAGLVLLCGALLVAATSKNAVPEVLKARAFHVVGNDGQVLVKLEDTFGAGDAAFGTVTILNGKGQHLVELSMTLDGKGAVSTLNGKGQTLVELTAFTEGPGAVVTYDPRSIEARGVYTTRP